jgi:hypothetical protein
LRRILAISGEINQFITRSRAERLRTLARRYATALRAHDAHRDSRGLDLVEAVIDLIDAGDEMRVEPARIERARG